MREILYAMAFLQENKMVHGDLRPCFIGVPLSANKDFYLLDRLGNPLSPEDAQKLNIENKTDLYISPSLFKSILKNKPKIKHNAYKSDIFAFGMILLEAGILESVQGVYNIEDNGINEEVLVELVEKFIDNYPDDVVLQEGLMIMLEFSEKLRQEPVEILESLRELKESEEEEGGITNSYMNYTTDYMMNKVKVTESGYEYKEADHLNVSNFSRIYNKSINPDDDGDRRSLAGLVRTKHSKVLSQSKNNEERKIEYNRGFNVKMEVVDPIVNKKTPQPQRLNVDDHKDDELFESFKQLSNHHKEKALNSQNRDTSNDQTKPTKIISQNVFDINEYMEYYEVKPEQIDTTTHRETNQIISRNQNYSDERTQTMDKGVTDTNHTQNHTYQIENIENDSNNIKESAENKASVYDLVQTEQYGGIVIEKEEDKLEIIKEEGSDSKSYKGNQVKKMKLYKGPVSVLRNSQGLRESIGVESRSEEKMKVINNISQSNENMIQVTRKVRQIETQKVESKDNILNPKDSLHPDFGISHQRFNEELLSQLPTDPFKNQNKGNNNINTNTQVSGNSLEKTVKSNFTYGKNSSKPSNQFKSEILAEPLHDETRVRRKSVKKKISKEEYERIVRENNGQTRTTTIRRISVNTDPNEIKNQHNTSTKEITSQKSGSNYLKLVIDENGNKRYQLVSNTNSNTISPRNSSNQVFQKTTKRFESSETSNQIIQINSKQVVSSTNSNYQNVKYGSLTQTNVKSVQEKYVNSSGNRYKTYTYGGSRRFGEPKTNEHKERVVQYSRSRSPLNVDNKKMRKSSQKVTIYRNGVKISEKVYNQE